MVPQFASFAAQMGPGFGPARPLAVAGWIVCLVRPQTVATQNTAIHGQNKLTRRSSTTQPPARCPPPPSRPHDLPSPLHPHLSGPAARCLGLADSSAPMFFKAGGAQH